MTTKREEILAAVKTALAGTSGVSTRIYRSRVEAFRKSEHPSIIVEPITDSASHNTTPRLIWDLIFGVTLLVRADEPDSAGDAAIADIHSKIMGSTTISNLVVDIQAIKTDWQFIEADDTLAIIINQYKVTYQTSLNDLTSV